MNVDELLFALRKLSREKESLKTALLKTREAPNPLSEFCRIAREEGIPLYEMDLLTAGEEAYAAMKRSTNGGGENSPALIGEDDYYGMFLAEMEAENEKKSSS
ncbi:MAG: hypothetical protein K6E30_08130 [Lachnospiraceae bacterium]|nr:hypothetical protein [Lachnospiraceae bacterium]